MSQGGTADPRRASGYYDPELDPPFDLLEPAGPRSNIILSSPHSGNIYPARFLASARLDSSSSTLR